MLDETENSFGYPRQVLRAGAYDALLRQTAAYGRVGTMDPRTDDMTQAERAGQAKKVFVSYSWESDDPEHQRAVLRFTNQLRQFGFDATMDLFEQNPPEGLPQWMLNQIRRSAFVLMIITETYRKRCEGDEEPGRGKGVKWEGGIVTRSIYQAEFQNRKFLPVLFGEKHVKSIPTILAGNTYYDVTIPDRFEDLVRVMTDQPAYIPVPIGQTPILAPKQSGATPGSGS